MRDAAESYVGDGTVRAALSLELQTGQQVGGHWHGLKAADLSIRLINLLNQDEKFGGTILSDADRAVAERELGMLWDALNEPDMAGVETRWLMSNESAMGTLKSMVQKMQDSPALQERTGATFSTNEYNGRRVRVGSADVPKLLQGFGAAGDLLFVIDAIIQGANGGLGGGLGIGPEDCGGPANYYDGHRVA